MGIAPAAREGDLVICTTHGPGATDPDFNNVTVNDKNAVVVTDVVVCAPIEDASTGQCKPAPKAQVITGSTVVRFNSFFAARAGVSKIDHGGLVFLNASNVLIGGPDGKTVGAGAGSVALCQAAAASRHNPGSPHQTWGNCCMEAWRQMVNLARAQQDPPLPPLSEDQLTQMSVANGANGNKADQEHYGNMGPGIMEPTLAQAGLPTENIPIGDLPDALAQGKAACVNVNPAVYWPPGTTDGSINHEIMVTGVATDENGNVVGYYVNDTSLSKCSMFMPAATMNAALTAPRATVSTNPVWK